MPAAPPLGGHGAQVASLPEGVEDSLRRSLVQVGWIELVSERELHRTHDGLVSHPYSGRREEILLVDRSRSERKA
jgi:hypothetical protein